MVIFGLGRTQVPQERDVFDQFADICYAEISAIHETPMTRFNFSRTCYYLGEINVKDSRFAEISSILSRAAIAKNGDFDNENVRVKITLPKRNNLYIDMHGGIFSNCAESRLDGARLARLEQILRHLEKNAQDAQDVRSHISTPNSAGEYVDAYIISPIPDDSRDTPPCSSASRPEA